MKQLTEKEAEDLLEKSGLVVVRREIANTKEDLMNIAKKMPFPWAMKVSSPQIVHKAKTGGVAIGIKNIIQADFQFDKFSNIQGSPGAMVQEMLSGSEVIVGVKKTSEFGHVLMFGKGGSDVEKEKDVSFRVIPATKKDIDEMISETKISFELKKNKVNMKSIHAVLEKIQKLVSKSPQMSELDINPLFVNSNSAVVADARISFEN